MVPVYLVIITKYSVCSTLSAFFRNTTINRRKMSKLCVPTAISNTTIPGTYLLEMLTAVGVECIYIDVDIVDGIFLFTWAS